MSWLDWFRSRSAGPVGDDEAAMHRLQEWDRALESNQLPGFVETRLKDAATGKVPWIATMTRSPTAPCRA